MTKEDTKQVMHMQLFITHWLMPRQSPGSSPTPCQPTPHSFIVQHDTIWYGISLTSLDQLSWLLTLTESCVPLACSQVGQYKKLQSS